LILIRQIEAEIRQLPLAALFEHNLASEGAVARDGGEALGYPYRRGS
jgi:hypothetical protein